MRNKIKLVFIIGLIFLLTTCGFKKITQEDTKGIYIQNINVSGERRSAYTIKNNILLISDDKSENKYDIEIKINKQKNNKIKDKTGKTTRYNLTISVDLNLTDINNNTKVKKKFIRNRDYDVVLLHSETISNEQKATKNIIQRLSQDVVDYLKLIKRN
jgi:outer membrane lipopolysaccharide assembly protein LptE/RlpB